MIVPDDWHRRAACRDHPRPDIFFPSVDATFRDELEARSLCRTCPVKIDCREYALAHEQHGIWGGLSEQERRSIRRRRKREATAA